jgi:hypothetical protein
MKTGSAIPLDSVFAAGKNTSLSRLCLRLTALSELSG